MFDDNKYFSYLLKDGISSPSLNLLYESMIFLNEYEYTWRYIEEEIHSDSWHMHHIILNSNVCCILPLEITTLGTVVETINIYIDYHCGKVTIRPSESITFMR